MTSSVSTSAVRGCRANDRSNIYQDITSKIIADLEAGRVPWVQPWGSSGVPAPLAMPTNAATGRRYSGINVLILWAAVAEHGFPVQSWLTFKQALALGGHVRKGERGTTVVYADRFVPDEAREQARDRGEEPRAFPFLKRFTVFNVEQCEGLPGEIAAALPAVDATLILPQAAALIQATGADIRIGGERAYYDVGGDFVRVPPTQAYGEPINWHRTALHELAHWSGAAQRLARDLSGLFGSKAYAREELVAELSTAYVCAALGIVPTVRHADYIGSWLEVLREDHRHRAGGERRIEGGRLPHGVRGASGRSAGARQRSSQLAQDAACGGRDSVDHVCVDRCPAAVCSSSRRTNLGPVVPAGVANGLRHLLVRAAGGCPGPGGNARSPASPADGSDRSG